MNGKKLADTVINIMLVITGVIFFIASQKIQVGAAMGQGGDFMPKVCSSVWLIISILLLVFNVKAEIPPRENPVRIKVFIITLVMLVVYVAALKPIGFVICSIVYLFLQMLLFVPKEKKTKKTLAVFAVISLVVPVAVNALFVNVFSLILPAGILK